MNPTRSANSTENPGGAGRANPAGTYGGGGGSSGGTTAADAATAAIGVCYETVTATDIANSIPVRVSALGVGPTKLMVAGSTASGVIAAGAVVAQDAAGTVKAYTGGAGIVVGRALTASSVAGDVLEVASCIAMPYPTAAS